MTVISSSGSSFFTAPDPNKFPQAAVIIPTLPQGGVLNQLVDFALINGLQTFGGGVAQRNGYKHLVIVCGYIKVTAAETGGIVNFVSVQGGNNLTFTLDAGGHAAAGTFPFSLNSMVDDGSSFGIQQASALSAGAAVISYQMYVN